MIWKLFKPNIKKLKEKRNINRLIKTLSDNDIELRRRAASALGEVVNRVGAENAIETICEVLDYGKLKTLGFKKTFEESVPLDSKKKM